MRGLLPVILLLLARPALAQPCIATIDAPRAHATSGSLVMRSADFDADGHVDLVALSDNMQPASIDFGTGAGFSDSVIVAEKAYTGPLVGDFDGDDKLDLILSVHTAEGPVRAALVRNLGGRRFALPQLLPFPTYATPSAAGDFDGDGDLDILIDGYPPRIFLNDGRGAFEERKNPWRVAPSHWPIVEQIEVAELTGDRHLDFFMGVESSVSYVFRGYGDGTFAAIQSGFMLGHVALAHMNGDRHIDMVTSRQWGPVSVLAGPDFDADAPISSVTAPHPQSAVTGDFNGDGAIDVAVVNRAEDPWSYKPKIVPRITIFLNDGHGKLKQSDEVVLPSSPYYRRVLANDFDNDGNLDLVFRAGEWRASSVAVIPGRGDGTFRAPRIVPQAEVPFPKLAADIDGDGVDEIVGGDLRIGRLDPTGHYAFAETLPAAGSNSVALGDPNSHGSRTIVTARSTALRLYSRDLTGLWTLVAEYPVEDTRALATADVDGDGHREILAITYRRPGFAVLRVLSAATGAHRFFTFLDASSSFWVEAAHVDGDTRLDLIVAGSATSSSDGTGTIYAADGYVSILRGNGDASFGLEERLLDGIAMVSAPRSGDFNGDGHADVVAATKDGVLLIALSDGRGRHTISQLPSRGAPDDALTLITGDVNGDGIDDVLTGSNVLYEGSRNGFIDRGSFFLGPATASRVLARRKPDGRPSVVAWIGEAGEMVYADFGCRPRKRRATR